MKSATTFRCWAAPWTRSARKVCEKVKVLGDIGYRYFVVTPTFYIAVRTADGAPAAFRAGQGAPARTWR